jgi:phage baseplate assembly protein W
VSTTYRAWLFAHPILLLSDEPSLDESETGLEISPRGTIAMAEGSDAVRQSLLLLISTIPGERIMRPEYGCELHRLVFAPNDDTTAGLAIFYVRRAIERWEPRIEILRLDAQAHPDLPEWLDVLLEYRVRDTQRTASLRFSYNLAGGMN